MRNIFSLPGVAFVIAVATSAMPVPAADAVAHDFEWLSGHWCSRSDGRVVEELWLPAGGHIALGIGRTVEGGKTRNFEFMRIESRDGAIDFISVLEGQPPTAFRLAASGPQWARFENPRHDFPTRIEYRRTPIGLHAEIAGPGKDGGERRISFDYRRCLD